jgi:hypothetical protein
MLAQIRKYHLEIRTCGRHSLQTDSDERHMMMCTVYGVITVKIAHSFLLRQGRAVDFKKHQHTKERLHAQNF